MSLFFALCGFLLLTMCNAFPDGAPIESCIYRNKPNHAGTKPLPPGTSPFSFTASSAHYSSGDILQVRITGGPPFKGFFIQARDAHSGKWIGVFAETQYAKTHDECSAITHSHPGPKKDVILTWKAPLGISGDVYFTGTILEKFDKYWSDLKAIPIHPQHLHPF